MNMQNTLSSPQICNEMIQACEPKCFDQYVFVFDSATSRIQPNGTRSDSYQLVASSLSIVSCDSSFPDVICDCRGPQQAKDWWLCLEDTKNSRKRIRTEKGVVMGLMRLLQKLWTMNSRINPFHEKKMDKSYSLDFSHTDIVNKFAIASRI